MQLLKANKERIKTLFILLLSVSAVVLAFGTGLFDAPIGRGGADFGGEGSLSPGDQRDYMQAAARPGAALAMIAPDAARGHLLDFTENTADGAGLRALYDLFSAHLGEALGSSGVSEPVSRADWEDALTNPGVFFRYDIELPGAVLARWLGTEVGGADGLMQSIHLSAGQDTVYLYYMGRDGTAYRSLTAVRSADLHMALETLEPNGAVFGFSEPAYRGADPDTILLSGYGGIPTIREQGVIGTLFAQQDSLVEHLGLSPALAGHFDVGGMRTIVEDGTTLRLHESGLITFHCQSESPRLSLAGEGAPDLSEAIEAARRIVRVLELTSLSAEVALTDWHYYEGQFVLEFGYYIGGVPIWTEYPAATVFVTGRDIRELTLFARAFDWTGDFAPVIPALQAAAAAGGNALRLTYTTADSDRHNDTELRARWLLAGEARHG